jgi:hypothetical protein
MFLVSIDVVEFETAMDKRKQKPIAINIIPTSPEIIGENRVDGTIAVVARQPPTNGVKFFFLNFSWRRIDF